MIIEIILSISVVLSSRAERALHLQLFHPSTYNPRVIPDMWTKKTNADYANLGAFATAKCSALEINDTINYDSGSLEMIYIFKSGPGKDQVPQETQIKELVTCDDEKETIHYKFKNPQQQLVIAPDDWLVISYDGLKTTFDSSLDPESIPDKAPNNWFDTESSWLEINFMSRQSQSLFRLEVKCVHDNETYEKGLLLRDDVAAWTRQVKCKNPYEYVRYKSTSLTSQLSIHLGKTPNTWVDSKVSSVEVSFVPNQMATEWTPFELTFTCEASTRHSNNLNLVAGIEHNQTLFDMIASITTVDSVKNFTASTNQSFVDNLTKLTYFDEESHLFYVKYENRISVSRFLPSSKCAQFLMSNMARMFFNKTRVDYTTVSTLYNYDFNCILLHLLLLVVYRSCVQRPEQVVK